jgi:hypothetical protein
MLSRSRRDQIAGRIKDSSQVGSDTGWREAYSYDTAAVAYELEMVEERLDGALADVAAYRALYNAEKAISAGSEPRPWVWVCAACLIVGLLAGMLLPL